MNISFSVAGTMLHIPYPNEGSEVKVERKLIPVKTNVENPAEVPSAVCLCVCVCGGGGGGGFCWYSKLFFNWCQCQLQYYPYYIHPHYVNVSVLIQISQKTGVLP